MQSWRLDKKIQVTTARIIEWYEHYNGLVYVAFSGGKDSTVLLDLVRKIYPDVPAVFCDTGLEFPEVRQFAMNTENVVVLRPEMNFRKVIETCGYPIVSKRVADTVEYGHKPGSFRWKELHGEIVRSNGTKSEFNFVSKILSSCVIAALLVFPAQAASSEEIQQQIDSAIEKQNMAHQIAEYVRSFGESESNPVILFAQEKWWEQQRILTNLYQQYDQAVQDENNKGEYIGTFRISHYCPCSTCNGGYSGTASGAPLTPWVSIAVDPSVIPLGSTVYIDGYGEFKAHDTGSAIKGNRIDVCVGSHSEAYRLGVVYRDVYVK